MPLNSGHAYKEQLSARAQGHTVLSYLIQAYTHSSAETWKFRLQEGEVLLQGQVVRGDELLQPGHLLVWNRPPWQEDETPQHYEIAFQDEHLLAVIKPSGLPTLPAGGFLQNTLLTLVRRDFPQASPLHRLGRCTSGLVLFARTHEAGSRLAKAWREHEVHKTYLALSSGTAEQDFYDIQTPIGPVPHPQLGLVFAASEHGKPSQSKATVLERAKGSTLFSVDIMTGRPHQIRIHLASIGHPLVGDPLYGPDGKPLNDLPGLPGDGGYLLHAHQLVFRHPFDGHEVSIQAPAPQALQLQFNQDT